MSHATLSQVKELASRLSFEDQLTLLEHIAQRVRMSPPGRVPQDLYGAWKGKFPDDPDVDGILREARAEWEKEWTDDGDFVG